IGVFWFLEPCQHAEARQYLQWSGCAGSLGQLAVADQLLVDLLLFLAAQAVRNLDHRNPVEEGLVVPVVAEALPFRLIGVGENDTLIGDSPNVLGTDVISLL